MCSMNFSHDVIIKPIVTEKSMRSVGSKCYVFKVAKDANKHKIKSAVEECFGVKVLKVNTMNVRGHFRRQGRNSGGYTASWKKAIVTLAPTSKSIEYFESVV